MIIKKTNNQISELTYDKDQFKITHTQEVSDILKFNYEMQKDETQQNGFSRDRELRWIGDIPMPIYLDHLRRFPQESKEPGYWVKWLSKSENQPFRTVPLILGGKTKYV